MSNTGTIDTFYALMIFAILAIVAYVYHMASNVRSKIRKQDDLIEKMVDCVFSHSDSINNLCLSIDHMTDRLKDLERKADEHQN